MFVLRNCNAVYSLCIYDLHRRVTRKFLEFFGVSKNSGVFFSQTLLKQYFKWEIQHIDECHQGIFCKIRVLFQFSKKPRADLCLIPEVVVHMLTIFTVKKIKGNIFLQLSRKFFNRAGGNNLLSDTISPRLMTSKVCVYRGLDF